MLDSSRSIKIRENRISAEFFDNGSERLKMF